MLMNSLVTQRLYLKSEMSLVKPKGNCYHSDGMRPKLQLLPSCCRSSACAESHRTLLLCCNLPPALQKVAEGARIKSRLKNVTPHPCRNFTEKGLDEALIPSSPSEKHLCPSLDNHPACSGFEVVLYGRLCKKTNPICITT